MSKESYTRKRFPLVVGNGLSYTRKRFPLVVGNGLRNHLNLSIVMFATPSLGGGIYFLTFIDDNTHCVGYVLKTKDQVFEKFAGR